MRVLFPFLASLACLGAVRAETFIVQVGANTPVQPLDREVHTDWPDPTFEWTFMKYYPNSITINVGDTISFQQTWGQLDKFHTINFNPLVSVPGPNGTTTMSPFIPVGGPPPPPGNFSDAFPPKSQFYLAPQIGNMGSGTGDQRQRFVHNGTTAFIASGFFVEMPFYNPTGYPAFNVTFTAAGTFTGYCIVHTPGMTISITVNPANTAYPMTPTQVTTAARATYDADINSAAWRNRHIGRDSRLLLPIAASEFPSGFTPSGGQWMVRVGVELEGASTPRFIPDNIEINVGDVLHFYSKDSDVHTVTIHAPNVDVMNRDTNVFPGTVIFKDFPSTPGNLTHPYEFNGYAHSGLILNEAIQNAPFFPPFFLKSPFSIRFNTVGKFHLMCLIHNTLGMEGVINVKPTTTCPSQQASTVNINFSGMFGGK